MGFKPLRYSIRLRLHPGKIFCLRPCVDYRFAQVETDEVNKFHREFLNSIPLKLMGKVYIHGTTLSFLFFFPRVSLALLRSSPLDMGAVIHVGLIYELFYLK
jgi:hypothetical protein